MVSAPTPLRRPARALLLLLACAGLLSACGGGDSTIPVQPAPTSGPDAVAAVDPHALDRALLETSLDLERAGAPVLRCLEDPGCEVLAEPERAKRYERAIDEAEDEIEVAMALAPDACLGDAARTQLDMLAAMRGVPRAHNEYEAWEAFLRARELSVELAAARTLCTPFSGPAGRADIAIGRTVVRLEERFVFRLLRCADAKCRAREGAALAEQAALAAESVRPQLEAIQDRCAAELGRLALEQIDGYRRLGAALEKRKDGVARTVGTEIGDLALTATHLYLRCLDDPGVGGAEGVS